MNRRRFIESLGLLAGTAALTSCASETVPTLQATSTRPPNFIVIIVDDLGYSDLGCYGGTDLRTPRLNQMAAEGARLTDFYVTAPVCTPTRASLMTGRLPQRCGLTRLLWPHDTQGLPAEEKTIQSTLRENGYATACIGKWHLGHQPNQLPPHRGFDEWYGLPYPNDMDARHPTNGKIVPESWPDIPLLDGDRIVEIPINDDLTTQRLTARAEDFIRRNREKPFFLYLPQAMPHTRLGASENFKGKSKRGMFGDAVEELDWSVGHILDLLKELNLDENTVVLFTNDNGATLPPPPNASAEAWAKFDALRSNGDRSHGINLPLRGGKQEYYEGGIRVPCIIRAPKHVKPGQTVSAPISVCDILPTFLEQAALPAISDRALDGISIAKALSDATTQNLPERPLFFGSTRLSAVREGRWKLIRHPKLNPPPQGSGDPQLYDLSVDLSEKNDVAAQHPEIVKRLSKLLDQQAKIVRSEAKSRGYEISER